MSTSDTLVEAHSAQVALPPGQLYIDGQWQDSTGTDRRDVVDPSTGRVVMTVAEATAEDVDRAVQAARGPSRATPGGP
jgi:acyl-CoA reductase-like NAD-dependent aldehyde dehydrogenase